MSKTDERRSHGRHMSLPEAIIISNDPLQFSDDDRMWAFIKLIRSHHDDGKVMADYDCRAKAIWDEHGKTIPIAHILQRRPSLVEIQGEQTIEIKGFTPAMPTHVFKLIQISSQHLRPGTIEMLNRCDPLLNPHASGGLKEGKIYVWKPEEGAWLLELPRGEVFPVEDDIDAIVAQAQNWGATFILISRLGPVMEELETFGDEQEKARLIARLDAALSGADLTDAGDLLDLIQSCRDRLAD